MLCAFSKIPIAAGLIAVCIFGGRADADLLIYHFDVGMGDSTLILDTATNRTLLIDAGNRGKGRGVVAPALKDIGISQISYFLATHYDSDHIGGFDELIEEGITVTDAVFDRGNYTDRQELTARDNPSQYGEYLTAATPFGRQVVLPSCTPPIDLGPDTSIEVVASRGYHLGLDCTVTERNVANSRDNDLSVALIVRHGDFSYFIGGDLTGGGNRTTPMEALVRSRVGDVDILKVNHHGSETSSSEPFLATLSPEVAIISVGDGGVNKTYRLPRQSVLDRIAALDPRPLVFLTNKGEGGEYEGGHVEHGHIVVHTNGTGYSVNGMLLPRD